MYPKWFKEYIVAFHNMRGQISLHTDDAIAKQSEREASKARGKRGR